MEKIFSLLKQYRIHVGIALFLMMVELVVELIQPLLMAKIIDQGILEEDMAVVVKWGAIMVLVSIAAFAAGVINSFFAAHVSQSVSYDIRKVMYTKIQNFSFVNLSRFTTSSLVTRLTSDVTQVQNTVFMGLRIMLRAPLLIIGGMLMAFIVDYKLALILAFTVPILFIFIVYIIKQGRKNFKYVQQSLDKVNSVMRENVASMRVIKAFLRHPYEADRFEKANTKLMKDTSYSLRLMETIMPVLLFVMNISILVLLWFGRNEIINGNVQVGEVVAIINYALRITSALSMLNFIIAAISRFRASADRITEVLTEEVDLADHDTAQTPLNNKTMGNVEFDQVSFRYPHTEQAILQDITFSVKEGQTVAILGATGSGKSTLFQLIPRFYDVEVGAVKIAHLDVRDRDLADLRRTIGYVPQEALLFTGSIKENIAWGQSHATMDEIITAAKDAQIHDTIVKLPDQYDTMVGQKGVNLSGGQKQRISIARALVRKPNILLLDDSTSALDLKTEAQLLKAINSYTCTTFIITQKISTAKDADLILLLEDGKLLAKGTHQSLIKTVPLYQKIYQSQFHKGVLEHA
jgi:ATP-binding cassette, subfamily B, multidrug efflux pump